MKRTDLDVLLRACKGDANAVALQHIFNQQHALLEDEHRFLEEHMSSLEITALMRWLAGGAPRPGTVIDRVVELWPDGESFVALWFIPDALRAPEEAREELAERLRRKLDHPSWCALPRSLSDVCPTFRNAAKDEHAAELVHALFHHRRDERACRKELLSLARKGGVLVRGPAWTYAAKNEPRSPLVERASLLAWMEGSGLLAELSADDVLPDDVPFPGRRASDQVSGAEDYLLRLALRWPGRNSGAARAWYVRQVLDAVRTDGDWDGILRVIVGASGRTVLGLHHEPHVTQDTATQLLVDIARETFGGPIEAPWIGYEVCFSLHRGKPDAWERAFRFLGRDDLHFTGERIAEAVSWVQRLQRFFRFDSDPLWPHQLPDWILWRAPLPEAGDDTFDEQILQSFGGRSSGQYEDVRLVERLSRLPLTRGRSNRLLKKVLSVKLSLVPTPLLARLVEAADPPASELVPSAEDLLYPEGRVDAQRLSIFRRLAGPDADEKIRSWMRAPLDRPNEPDDMAAWGAAGRMRWDPGLAPEGLKAEILKRILREPLLDILDFQSEYPLLLGEQQILEVALSRVHDMNETWARHGKVSLPQYLADAVEQRCRATSATGELLRLSRWLLDLGREPRVILPLLLDRSPRLPWDSNVQQLLRCLLHNRSGWETFGPTILDAMLMDHADRALFELARFSANGPEGTTPTGITTAIHEALAVALLKRVKQRLDEGDEPGSLPILHALVALHPPARLSAKLARMKEKTAPEGEAHDMVELVLRLLKRSKTGDARLDDVSAALSLLRESAAA
ncbi:MAG: hypothetical protein R3B70_43015 [Polyangiaceae bacterium]